MPRLTDRFSRLSITLITELDEQGQSLMRQLQRTRARVNHRWPIPERVGESTDIVVCEFTPDMSRRYAWMPGEATAASIILLPQSGQYDLSCLQASIPDAVIHRPYQPNAVLTALTIGWDHFSFCSRQRGRIARLDENLRTLRDIERAKHFIMADKNINEHNAFNVLRTMAMERRMTIAALAGSLVDSRESVG
jgi:two-component system, response regulator / RNA-binding antiterminator